MYEGQALHVHKLAWVIRNFCCIGFNSTKYDLPMLQIALAGATCSELKAASDAIILEDKPHWELTRHYDADSRMLKNIDLIEVAPLMGSLKIYGGRLHSRRMWDLPFPPHAKLSGDQMLITRRYCINDLDLTEDLFSALREQIELREKLELVYEQDLCSMSDAQIAEAAISHDLQKLGVTPRKAQIQIGAVFQYQPPAFLRFQTEVMQKVFGQICALDFVVGDDGYVINPQALEDLELSIGGHSYTLGLGGLHSCEKTASHRVDGSFTLVDRDVSSYYPAIILNCGLFPEHLGQEFLKVYSGLVRRRLAAKKAKNRVEADSLKITINGTFGKLGSKWSILYSPNLLLQVTITGQLSLLMLIEVLEKEGITVVSANTDGIVMAIPVGFEKVADRVVSEWESDTGFETEAVEYDALYSRDVNNYIAIKKGGAGTKNKGAFANPWADENPSIFRLHKNPTTTICIDAVEQYLINTTPLLDTIKACADVRKFITIRTVKGGAVKDGIYLGKAIRWYYSTSTTSEIIYASNGNKVAKTDGAQPLMILPETVPEDVNYAWYEEEAGDMLASFGIIIS
jgi:hypothetical protein